MILKRISLVVIFIVSAALQVICLASWWRSFLPPDADESAIASQLRKSKVRLNRNGMNMAVDRNRRSLTRRGKRKREPVVYGKALTTSSDSTKAQHQRHNKRIKLPAKRDKNLIIHPLSRPTAVFGSRPKLNSTTIASMKIRMNISDTVDVFYTLVRGDRSGSATLDMLAAHAFAWTLGRKYGGVCGPISRYTQDHLRLLEVMGLRDEFRYPVPPEPCDTLTNNTAILLPRAVYLDWKNSDIFTPEWIDLIQKRRKLPPRGRGRHRLQKQSLFRSKAAKKFKKRERIIVHIRRGDVTPCIDESARYTPNSHYARLINRIATNNTDTFYDVTIYSETESFESWEFFNNSDCANVAYHLSLDGDIADVWSDMLGYNDDPSTKRTLILATSTFSFVPAMLVNRSTTTVLYTLYGQRPLSHWQVVDWETTEASFAATQSLRDAFCSINSSGMP